MPPKVTKTSSGGTITEINGGKVYSNPSDNPNFKPIVQPNASTTPTDVKPAPTQANPTQSPVLLNQGQRQDISAINSAGSKAEETIANPSSLPQIESDLFGRYAQQSQGLIDAITNQQNTQIEAVKKTGEDTKRAANTALSTAGLGGSTVVAPTMGNVDKDTEARVSSIIADRGAKIQEVMSNVQQAARTDAVTAKNSETTDATNAIALRDKIRQDAGNAIKEIASSGTDLNAIKQNYPDEYAHLVEAMGGDENLVAANFALNKPQTSVLESGINGEVYYQVTQDPVTKAISTQSFKLGFSPSADYNAPVVDRTNGTMIWTPKKYDPSKPNGGAIVVNYGMGGTGNSDVAEITKGIVSGNQPPILTGLYGKSSAVRAELQRQGFNLAKAQQDWQATTKYLSSLNSTQQLRFRQAIGAVPEMLDSAQQKYDNTYKILTNAGIKTLNKANLKLAKEGAYGPEAQSAASNLEIQVADLVSDLATIYRGGNTPTDEALSLASQQLNGEWDAKTFKDAISTIKDNMKYRMNSVNTAGVAGVGNSNPYDPTSGNGSSNSQDPSTMTDEQFKTYFDSLSPDEQAEIVEN